MELVTSQFKLQPKPQSQVPKSCCLCYNMYSSLITPIWDNYDTISLFGEAI